MITEKIDYNLTSHIDISIGIKLYEATSDLCFNGISQSGKTFRSLVSIIPFVV